MMWDILVEERLLEKASSFFLSGRQKERSVDWEPVGLEVYDSLHFTCIH